MLSSLGILNCKYSISGQLETTSVDSITSEDDIVVGASITTKDQNSTPSKQFSGEIDDVLLYDYVLEDEQIFAMYEQTKDAYAVLEIPELSIEEIAAQITAELADNTTTTELIDNTTTTELIDNTTTTEPIDITITELLVAPTLTTMKESYQISEDVELELEFFDEFDVLANELEELENALAIIEAELEPTLLETEIDLGNATLTNNDNSTVTQILQFFYGIFTIQNAEAANDAPDIAQIRQEIQILKDQIQAIKASQSLDPEDIKAAKSNLKEILKQIKGLVKQLKTDKQTRSRRQMPHHSLLEWS